MAFISYFFVFAFVILCSSAKSYNTFGDNGFKQISPTLGLSWKNCGPLNDPIQVLLILVAPDPVIIPGNFTVALSLNSSTELTRPITVSILAERKAGPFFVKIPCIDKVGSCTYADVCDDWAKFCPEYLEKYGFTCTCPMPPKSFVITDAGFSVDSVVKPELLGDYRVTADLSTTDGHAGCVQIELTVKPAK